VRTAACEHANAARRSTSITRCQSSSVRRSNHRRVNRCHVHQMSRRLPLGVDCTGGRVGQIPVKKNARRPRPVPARRASAWTRERWKVSFAPAPRVAARCRHGGANPTAPVISATRPCNCMRPMPDFPIGSGRTSGPTRFTATMPCVRRRYVAGQRLTCAPAGGPDPRPPDDAPWSASTDPRCPGNRWALRRCSPRPGHQQGPRGAARPKMIAVHRLECVSQGVDIRFDAAPADIRVGLADANRADE
jgi:hypothetical protein